MSQDLIAGRYRVERGVGKGGMGTVWLCRDEVLHRDVALKQLDAVAGESADDTRRALREARTAAALNHRNAVSIYDIVDHDGAPWLVMEYVDSRTLSELLKEGPLPAGRVAKIGAQVASALAAAHQAGITHRDVKPGNILVGDDDLAKISDFGISRIAHDDQLTATGMLTGTPAYFSPELARGGEPGAESDVWALGATLYAAVEGRPPHPKQPNAIATLTAIASEPVPRPVRAGVLLEPLAHLLDPDPDARWTMVEAEDALRRLVARTGTTTTPAARALGPVAAAEPPTERSATTPAPSPTPVPSPTPGKEPQPRSRSFPVLVTLAGLLLLGIVAVVLVQAVAGDPRTTPRSGSSASATPSASAEDSPTEAPPTTAPPTDQSPTEAATEDSPTPATTPAPGTAGGRVGTIATYFDTVPADLDAGWAMLAPSMQARVGRSSYDSFWATISAVDATAVRAGSGGTVSAQVTYTRTDGSTSVEQQTFVLESADGDYLIAADR